MGLDMYLEKEYYVKNWEHTPESERVTITVTRDGKPLPIALDKVKGVTTEEIY